MFWYFSGLIVGFIIGISVGFCIWYPIEESEELNGKDNII